MSSDYEISAISRVNILNGFRTTSYAIQTLDDDNHKFGDSTCDDPQIWV